MEKLVLTGLMRVLRTVFSARKWQRFWSKDWVLKVISLMLATMLWYFVGGEDIVDKNVMVPIEIINLPRDLVISNQFKKEIEVTVSGPRSAIEEMSTKSVTRQINLSTATPGTTVVENDNSSIPVPRGVTVLRIQPASVILSLDKLIQKQFKIAPVTNGTVAAGFELEKLVMSPDVITITGPETILSQADELKTEVIDLSGLKESKSVQIALDLDPTFISLIGETQVTAELAVKPTMVEKKVGKVKVAAVVGGEVREVAPEQVDVILKVPVLLLQEEKDLARLFSVGVAEEASGDFLKVNVIPNPNNSLPLEVVSIIPSAVKLVRPEPVTPEPAPEEKTMDEMPSDTGQSGSGAADELEKTQNAEPDDQIKKIEESTESGDGETGVKILPVRKKRKLL